MHFNIPTLLFLRKRESSKINKFWIPASSGMTKFAKLQYLYQFSSFKIRDILVNGSE